MLPLFPRKPLDSLTHDLSSFEFHSRTGRNYKAASWLVRVSPDPRFCQSRLKNSEVAQFNGYVVGQTVGDFVECPLNDIENLMLDHAGLVTDGDNDVAFG